VNYFAKFLAFATLANDLHFMVGDNLKLLYHVDENKFYPLWRIETQGKRINPKYNSIKQFNEVLFHTNDTDLNYQYAITNKLYKLLLKDDEFRDLRDKYLYELVSNKNSLLNDVKQTINDNDKIILHTSKSKEIDDFKNTQHIDILKSKFKLASNYLAYGHIYGSYDSINKNLNILFDAFVPVDMYYENTLLNADKNRGIDFDKNLKLHYNYYDIGIDEEGFNPTDLVFVNSVTNDTLDAKNVYINYINVE
jgi:hypothetical protein